jgi:hypothetical protein
MKRSITIRLVAAVVVIVLAAGTWITSGKVDTGWMRYFSAAVLIATLILAAWDLWLWRLGLVQRIPGVPRCVRGTWQGTLTSFWIDPATGTSPQPKTVYLVVHQTATLVTVKLFTNESRSTSTLAAVSAVDSAWTLAYLYLNRPDMHAEPHSRMHHGSTVFDVSGRPAMRLTGRYWTDRDSKGQLEFTRHQHKLADDFLEAATYFA